MASGTQELELFVKEALRHAPRAEVEHIALAAGWSGEQVRNALAGFAELDFAIPVPRPRPSLSAREAFLYLLLFSILYFWTFNLGSLLFDFIDLLFPRDVGAVMTSGQANDIRWAVASLIISFPAFCLLAWQIGREISANPVKRASPVRRWLTYLTLFVAASIVIGDLTTLVYNLLGGEATTPFLLKVLVVGVISGTGFGYYLLDLRKEEVAP